MVISENIWFGTCFMVLGLCAIIFSSFSAKAYLGFMKFFWKIIPAIETKKYNKKSFEKIHDSEGSGRNIMFWMGVGLIILSLIAFKWGWW